MTSRRVREKPTKFRGAKPGIFSGIAAKVKRFLAKRKISKQKRIINLPKVTSSSAKVAIFLAISLVVIVPLVLVIYPNLRGFYSIKFEKEAGDNSEITKEWKGEKRLNLLLIGLDRNSEEYAFVDALAVLSINPEKKELGVFTINPNIEVYLPDDRKTYSFKKIYNAGKLREKPESLDILVDSVEELISVRIDRYMSVDAEDLESIINVYGDITTEVGFSIKDEDIKSGKDEFSIAAGKNRLDGFELLALASADALGSDNKLTNQQEIIKGLVLSLDEIDKLYEIKNVSEELSAKVRSNLTGSEFRRLIWLLKQIPFDGIKLGETKESSVVAGTDGSLIPIMERIDNDVSEVFFNVDVQREQARVEVLNGTSKGGLGSRKARWVSNAGAKVINVGNSRDPYLLTTVYTTEPAKYVNTLKEIEDIFGVKIVLVEGDFPYRHTGDIVVVIGENSLE